MVAATSMRAATLDRKVALEREWSLDQLFPTSITITRTSDADWKTRQLVVHVDGRWAAELLWGDSVMLELEPGSHRLRVHNTLVWKTVDFTLTPGEQIFYEAINRPGLSTYFCLGFLLGIAPLFVDLRRL